MRANLAMLNLRARSCGDHRGRLPDSPRHRNTLHDHRPRTYLDRLIAFPTVSRDSNLELIAYVRETLTGFGIVSQLVPSEDGRKANLFATIGPADRPGIVLSGHTDVVPVEGQAWTSDPFR